MLCVGSRGPNDRREADISPSDSHHLHIIKAVTVGSIVVAKMQLFVKQQCGDEKP